MKCPTCGGLTLTRPITGHVSKFDQATGVTTRTRVCKDTACGAVFKTFERIDTDDGELRRRAFLYDLGQAREAALRSAIENLREALGALREHARAPAHE